MVRESNMMKMETKYTKEIGPKIYTMEWAFFQFRLGTKASSKMESNMDRVHHTAFRAKQRNMKAIGQITCLMAMVHSSTLRVYLVVHEQANTLVKLSKII